jgi:Fe-S-cluster formation regulator IscX/YfhJ
MIQTQLICKDPEDKRQEVFVQVALKIMDHPQFQQIINVGAVQDVWLKTTANITKKLICAMDQFEDDVRANGFEVKDDD